MTTQPTIEHVIAAIPAWAGRTVTAERVPAGLTNTNYRVDVDFTAWAEERWTRASAALDGRDLEDWLREVRGAGQ